MIKGKIIFFKLDRPDTRRQTQLLSLVSDNASIPRRSQAAHRGLVIFHSHGNVLLWLPVEQGFPPKYRLGWAGEYQAKDYSVAVADSIEHKRSQATGNVASNYTS